MPHLLKLFGQFHPAIVHIPIGLLFAAAAAEFIYLLMPRSVFHHIGAFNLHLGALGSLATVTMGWALAATMGMEPELKSTLAWHRWLGTACAVWAIIALALWYLHRKSPCRKKLGTYRVVLFSGAMLVGITGHLGGLLVYGLDYYTW